MVGEASSRTSKVGIGGLQDKVLNAKLCWEGGWRADSLQAVSTGPESVGRALAAEYRRLEEVPRDYRPSGPLGNRSKGSLGAGRYTRAVSPAPPRPAFRPAPPRPSAPVRGGRAAAVAAAASSGHFAPREETRGGEPRLEEARARVNGGRRAFRILSVRRGSAITGEGVGGPFPVPAP